MRALEEVSFDVAAVEATEVNGDLDHRAGTEVGIYGESEVSLEELAEDLRSDIYERKWERAIDTIKVTQRLFRSLSRKTKGLSPRRHDERDDESDEEGDDDTEHDFQQDDALFEEDDEDDDEESDEEEREIRKGLIQLGGSDGGARREDTERKLEQRRRRKALLAAKRTLRGRRQLLIENLFAELQGHSSGASRESKSLVRSLDFIHVSVLPLSKPCYYHKVLDALGPDEKGLGNLFDQKVPGYPIARSPNSLSRRHHCLFAATSSSGISLGWVRYTGLRDGVSRSGSSLRPDLLGPRGNPSLRSPF